MYICDRRWSTPVSRESCPAKDNKLLSSEQLANAEEGAREGLHEVGGYGVKISDFIALLASMTDQQRRTLLVRARFSLSGDALPEEAKRPVDEEPGHDPSRPKEP